MRKSLTCYALAQHKIPAMAVEVSKNITQIAWKVRQQLAATILLLSRFGVHVTPPDFTDADVQAYARQGRLRQRQRQEGGQRRDHQPGSRAPPWPSRRFPPGRPSFLRSWPCSPRTVRA